MSIAFLPAVPRFFWGSGFCGANRGCSIQPGLIDIKNEDAVLIERDFYRLPRGFVAVVGVLPVEGRFIVIGRNPLFDGLPGRLDGIESLDVEGWIRRWRDVDEALPHPQESKEKLDLLGLDEGFDSAHGAFAAGALEGIGSPGGEDEVATAVVGLDGSDGFRAEWAHGGAVVALVAGEEVIPGGVDDLPEGGGAGAAGLVDGRHNCSLEQLCGGEISSCMRERKTAQAANGWPMRGKPHVDTDRTFAQQGSEFR